MALTGGRVYQLCTTRSGIPHSLNGQYLHVQLVPCGFPWGVIDIDNKKIKEIMKRWMK